MGTRFLRGLFKTKKNREEDDLDKFMKQHNRMNVRENKKDPLEVHATACYHTDVAPKTRRGPKSLPGGHNDDVGHVNRSFETEVPRQRRRVPSPDNFKENRRHRAAFSDFNGPVSSRRTDIDYRTVVIPEESDEEIDVRELKEQLREMRIKYAHSQGKRQYYKQQFQEAADMRKRTEKAYRTQEDKYKDQIETLQKKNEILQGTVSSLQNQLHAMQMRPCHCHRPPPPSMYNFNAQYPTYPQPMSVSSQDICDPQPTTFPFTAMDFTREDRDETKIFTPSVMTDYETDMSRLDSNMGED